MPIDTSYYQSQKDRARAQYRSEAALNKQGRIVGNMQANRAIREYGIDNRRQQLTNKRNFRRGITDVRVDAQRDIQDLRRGANRGIRDIRRDYTRQSTDVNRDYRRGSTDLRLETARQRPEEYAQYGARGIRNSGVADLGIQRFEGDFQRELGRMGQDRDSALARLKQDRRSGVGRLQQDRRSGVNRIRQDRRMDVGRLRQDRNRSQSWLRDDRRRYTQNTPKNKGYLIQDRMAANQGYDLNLGSLQQQRDWALADIDYEKARDKSLAALNLSALKPYF